MSKSEQTMENDRPYRNTRKRSKENPPQTLHQFGQRLHKPNPKPKTKQSSNRYKPGTSAVMTEGSIVQIPIIIDGPLKQTSDVRCDAVDRTTQPVRRKKPSADSSIPYPDETSQHVRGPQTSFARQDVNICYRNAPSRNVEHLSGFSWQQLRQRPSVDEVSYIDTTEPLPSLESSWKENLIKDIPYSHRLLVPAVVRLYDFVMQTDPSPSETSCNSLWTEKWRPRRAEEVLGNEECALYLRDWLATLSLQTAPGKAASTEPAADKKGKRARKLKRPLVVRQADKVRKRQKRGPQERWNSDNNGTDRDTDTESNDGPLLRLIRGSEHSSTNGLETPTELSEDDEIDVVHPHYLPHDFGGQVCSTILLNGPSGCGKTTAVYACAEELGWEVFEVYPGMGERSGSVLNKLIGDLGRNHLVQQAPSRRASSPARPSVLDRFLTTSRKEGSSKALRRVMSDDEDAGPSCEQRNDSAKQSTLHPPSSVERPMTNASTSSVRQSLVLIEEVDVLFKSDTNFWPTLISLIKDCRRPVIMTCNGKYSNIFTSRYILTFRFIDISLVPCHDLPLQTTLTFSPCPSPLATSYLQLLCLAENRVVSRAAITTLYERAGRHGAGGSSDLRHAIIQLQFGCSSKEAPVIAPGLVHVDSAEKADSHHVNNSADGLREWRLMDKVNNIISCFDSYIHRGNANVAKVSIIPNHCV